MGLAIFSQGCALQPLEPILQDNKYGILMAVSHERC